MAPYRILTLDGGGIRGLLSAVLLERLEAAHPGFLAQIDLFAGTSTGSILALGLAAGIDPVRGRQLYEEQGPAIFNRSLWHVLRSLGGLVGARYNSERLREVLQLQFGDTLLADLPRRVLIPTFDLDNEPTTSRQPRAWKAKFFHNFPGPDSDAGHSVVDVAVRSCSAPTYLPIYQGYIDGGVVANNPSMCALAQALHPPTGGQAMGDLVLISIGTGHNPRFIASQDAEWGLVQWAPRLLNLLMDSGAGLADYQCRQVLGSRYLRLNPVLPEPVGLDRVNRISLLKRIGYQYDLSAAHTWIERCFT
jgi:uncharacterized protein